MIKAKYPFYAKKLKYTLVLKGYLSNPHSEWHHRTHSIYLAPSDTAQAGRYLCSFNKCNKAIVEVLIKQR